MLSENAKVEYLCEHCNNPDIKRIRIYGQDSYECMRCNRWFGWKTRRVVPAGEKYMLREDYTFIIGICIGLLMSGILALFIYNFVDTKFELFKWLGAVIIVAVVIAGTWANLKFRGFI